MPASPESRTEIGVVGEPQPVAPERIRVGSQQARLEIHDCVAHTGHVEPDGRGSSHRGFCNDEPPSLPGCGVEQEPRLAHQAVLFCLWHEPGELDAFDLQALELRPGRAVADHGESSSRLPVYRLPYLQK